MDSADDPGDGRLDLRWLLHAQLPRTPGGGVDTGEALGILCRLAVGRLEILGAVVTLIARGAGRAPPPVAGSSDAASRTLEEIQSGLGQGPGPDAYATGRPVLVGDVEASYARWPAWVTPARGAGVGAAYSFPLQLGAIRFGTLTMYDARPRELRPGEVTTCLTFAELATELLLAGSRRGTADTLEPGLTRALLFRSEVYQAQGKVAVQLGVSLVDALVLMQGRAFTVGVDLTDLAVSILDGITVLETP